MGCASNAQTVQRSKSQLSASTHSPLGSRTPGTIAICDALPKAWKICWKSLDPKCLQRGHFEAK
jgi:hypothetical protein